MLLEELAGLWLDSARTRLKESTVVSYRTAAAKALKYLGKKEIGEITAEDLKATEHRLAESGDSYQTARLMFNALRLSLDYAVEHGRLSVNPARHYTPHQGLYRKREGARAVSPGDAEALIQKYHFLHPYHMPLLLIYEAGLRSGEMMGLTWDYVDLERNSIHIVRQLDRLAGGKYKFSPLRAKSLVRDVVLGKELKEQLARWKRDQQLRGLLKEKNSFVCIETDGSPIHYDRFVYVLRKQGFTPQSLRKAHEDKAHETAEILRTRFSVEEIRRLQEAAISAAGIAQYAGASEAL